MRLAAAQSLAGKIVAEITPFCERMEIAGSIRRPSPRRRRAQRVSEMKALVSNSEVFCDACADAFVVRFDLRLHLLFRHGTAASIFPGQFKHIGKLRDDARRVRRDVLREPQRLHGRERGHPDRIRVRGRQGPRNRLKYSAIWPIAEATSNGVALKGTWPVVTAVRN